MLRRNPKDEIMKELSKKIKNYKGYHKDKDRKKTDDALKNYVLTQLRTSLDISNEVKEKAILTQQITIWPEVDKITKNIQDAITTVEHTDYMFSTFFEAINLEGFQLEYLRKLDWEIYTQLADLPNLVKEFDEAIEGGILSEVDRISNDIIKSIQIFQANWKDRQKLITSYQKLGLVSKKK